MAGKAIRLTLTTDQAIDTVLSGKGRQSVVSLADAVTSVRALLSECELRDQELAELIALHAMIRGMAVVSFDLRTQPHPVEALAF